MSKTADEMLEEEEWKVLDSAPQSTASGAASSRVAVVHVHVHTAASTSAPGQEPAPAPRASKLTSMFHKAAAEKVTDPRNEKQLMYGEHSDLTFLECLVTEPGYCAWTMTHTKKTKVYLTAAFREYCLDNLVLVPNGRSESLVVIRSSGTVLNTSIKGAQLPKENYSLIPRPATQMPLQPPVMGTAGHYAGTTQAVPPIAELSPQQLDNRIMEVQALLAELQLARAGR